MKTLRIVLIALVALAVGVMASADAQTPFLTLDTPNPQADALFGWSLALGDVDGDGKADIAVGARYEDVGGNANQGRAYVFSGADGSLLFTLDTPNPQADAWFGETLAMGDILGDGKAEIVVGAPGEDVGGNADQGRAYVFLLAIPAVGTIDTPNAQAWGYFGSSVAMGDVNGDGRAEIAVGAEGEAGTGRAYVFSGLSLLLTLTPPNPLAGEFGDSVAVGDVNGDGKADIAVGAEEEDVGGNGNQGRAYVFSGADGSLLLTLDTPNPQFGAHFGRGVAVGEVNGDGKADIAVGAYWEDVDSGWDQGRAYVFSGANGSLLFTLDTPNPHPQAWFGWTLAVEELNGDGKGDIVVGSGGEDVGATLGQGRVYVFSGANGSLLFALDTPNPQTQGYFGESVAVGDVNGEGKPDIAVGAIREDVGGNADQGRVYVFLADLDGDGLPDAEDNCPNDPNPFQENNDLDYPSPGDGPKGDACDKDDDNDGWEDTSEVPGGGGAGAGDTVGSDPFDPTKTPEVCDGIDNDQDGIDTPAIDEGFPDTDGDTIADCHDDWDDIGSVPFDADGDGTGNATDPNDDSWWEDGGSWHHDTFSDDRENYMGTDKAIMCSAAPIGGPDNDPLDINSDGKASIADIAWYFAFGGYGSYNDHDDDGYERRLDLSADGKLSIVDIMEYFAFDQYANDCPYGL